MKKHGPNRWVEIVQLVFVGVVVWAIYQIGRNGVAEYVQAKDRVSRFEALALKQFNELGKKDAIIHQAHYLITEGKFDAARRELER